METFLTLGLLIRELGASGVHMDTLIIGVIHRDDTFWLNDPKIRIDYGERSEANCGGLNATYLYISVVGCL